MVSPVVLPALPSTALAVLTDSGLWGLTIITSKHSSVAALERIRIFVLVELTHTCEHMLSMQLKYG